ncbi:hypothetical protein PTTG_27906 [Puccinia triticina 1-1 BBBD Race 1]|uniref:Uncharacterized protein n=1 Tax=Puccinia triticina (isolate 1-1 / race 1 (BBBD)) TaxID=630390 RepID=A0A180GH54_PUCT1|nr:hypothetical protein PTTG_27906 [Puccinia triticina 1-1 BBBD Race 1]WAR58610.1 hypothetical protein PtB15_5B844 [Puccinia triticina]
MVRHAQGGRSTPAVPGGQGTGPMRRTRKPAGPPDLRVLEDKCQVMVHRIEGLLQYAIEHPLTCATEYDCRPFQDAIPVIKLIRIFLNKLSRPTNNRPHPLAGMSPDNLLTIIRSTGKNIGKFLHRMKEIHPSGAMIGSGSKVFDLVYSLQRPINIVKLHLSQPGHSESPQGSHPKYREWMRVWDSNLCLAGCRIGGMSERGLDDFKPRCSFT